MSSEAAWLFLGFGIAGTFYALLGLASATTLASEFLAVRRVVERAEAVALRMESASNRKVDDADYWKQGYSEDEDED